MNLERHSRNQRDKAFEPRMDAKERESNQDMTDAWRSFSYAYSPLVRSKLTKPVEQEATEETEMEAPGSAGVPPAVGGGHGRGENEQEKENENDPAPVALHRKTAHKKHDPRGEYYE